MTEATLEQALHVDLVFLDGDPPPKRTAGRQPGIWSAIAHTLRDRPMQWAQVAGPFSERKPATARAAYAKRHGLEAVTRSPDDGTTYYTYARWVPGRAD